jgi:two-component system chemotaxis response regulator CheB
MPRSALQNVAVDHQVPVRAMAALLARLAREPTGPSQELPMEERKKTEIEVRTAAGDPRFERNNILEAGPLSPFTCPECHGVLAQLQEGSITRYRCHTGHAYSPPALLASLNDSVEDRLWDAARVLDETAMLLNHLGEHHERAGEDDLAGEYYGKAKEALERSKSIRSSAMAIPIADSVE